MFRYLRVVPVALASVATAALLQAQVPADFVERLHRGTALYEKGKYSDALRAFREASSSPDAASADAARRGIVRSALRVGEFTQARQTAEILFHDDQRDLDALTLAGDAFWAAGFFDAADEAYVRARTIDAGSPRARFGLARSLGSRSRLHEALAEIEGAVAMTPRDPDLHALRGARTVESIR